MSIYRLPLKSAVVASGAILVVGVGLLVVASNLMGKSAFSGIAGTGSGPANVNWGSKARWIIPTPHRMTMTNIAGGPTLPQFEAAATRYGFDAPYSTNRAILGVTTSLLNTHLGEVDVLPELKHEWERSREFSGSIAVGKNPGTAFRFGGMDSDLIATVGPRWTLSRPLNFQVKKGDEVWMRGAWYKPIDRPDQNAGWLHPMNRWIGLYSRVERNVAASAKQWILSNGSQVANPSDAGYVFFETKDPSIRCVKLTGSSHSVAGKGWGYAGDQDKDQTQPGGFLTKNANSAQVAAEYACWLGKMQWFAMAQSGSHIFTEFDGRIGRRKGDSNWEVKPKRYGTRRAIEATIGFTDDIWTGWTNEFAMTAPGLDLDSDVEAWAQAFRAKIQENIKRNCRTWIVLGPVQTFWRRSGSVYNPKLSEKEFRDSQALTVPQVPEVAFRKAILKRLDRLCKELGSAWVFDACLITHGLNSKGELVWARCPSPKGGFVIPTNYKDGERGTHYSHLNHQRVGSAFAKYFGKDGQTKFPPFGLLNPGEYR